MNITSEGEQLVNKSNLEGMKTIKIIDTVTGRVLFSITGLVCAVYEPCANVSDAQLSFSSIVPAKLVAPHDGTGTIQEGDDEYF